MRISDWSSDVCSSDLLGAAGAARQFARAQRPGAGHRLVEAEPVAEAHHHAAVAGREILDGALQQGVELGGIDAAGLEAVHVRVSLMRNRGICEARTMAATAGRRQSRTVHKRAVRAIAPWRRLVSGASRSEEHKSELQSLMRISYAGFCL